MSKISQIQRILLYFYHEKKILPYNTETVFSSEYHLNNLYYPSRMIIVYELQTKTILDLKKLISENCLLATTI